ncbi:MAG: TcpQ domain-containing protein [Rhodospirillales bacterium]|nr:TcpQ domain-containing protein [Rhodospirillales bacterium]
MTEAISAGAVLAAMAAMAVQDARRALVDPRLVLALLGAAAAWRFGGGGPETDGTWPPLASGVLGATLGVAAVTVPIAAAALLRRRWPLYPGDAMLLGAVGFLLGPLGLAWAMALGAGAGLLYRFCVQRKRGRPFRKGLVPLGPGMCAGAAAVFLCMNFGVALAGDTRAGDPRAGDIGIASPATAASRVEHGVTTTPLTPPAAERSAQSALAATELGPALGALPTALAAGEISVEWDEPMPFPALVRRLSTLAGVAMRIEERPARIEGGAAVLDDPPALRLAWHGPLAGLLDRVASLSGYGWSWEALVPETLVPETLGPVTRVPGTLVPGTRVPGNGAVVFFRYWDVAQRGPASGGGTGNPVNADRGEPGTGGGWAVDPDEHRTLRGVLEDWAARAGWTLVWKAREDYGLGAAAVFEGGFLEAADVLLSGPATRRTLDARAYAANRHLVVDDADGAGW